MALDLPSAAAEPGEPLRLSDLREIVLQADLAEVPDDTIVRAHLIPFRLADLGKTRGGVVRSIALDQPSTFRPRNTD